MEEWQKTREAAHRAWQERWKREAPEVPERVMCFTVTLCCTFSEFQEVQLALKGLCEGRKTYRQEEMTQKRRSMGHGEESR